MRQLEEAAMAKRNGADRVASAIARFCGSMAFVWLHVALFAGLDWLQQPAVVPGLRSLSLHLPHPGGVAGGDLSVHLHPDQPELRHARQRAAQPAGPADQPAVRAGEHQDAADPRAHRQEGRRPRRRRPAGASPGGSDTARIPGGTDRGGLSRGARPAAQDRKNGRVPRRRAATSPHSRSRVAPRGAPTCVAGRGRAAGGLVPVARS